MSRTALVCAVAIASLVSSVLIAQTGPSPGQATQKATPKTTALILGQVVDGSSGQPISDAIVTLSQSGGGRGAAPALPPDVTGAQAQAMQAAMAVAAAAAGRGAAGSQRVMTGTDGRFVFHDLAPGSYQLTASLSGYTASVSAGAGANAAASNPSSTAATLALREGEFATGVKLRLWKYAVVSGTVLDDAGEPAIGLTVQVARRSMAAGGMRYVPAGSGRTDDRGAYRISSLVPGDYVAAVPQTQVSVPTAVMIGMIESITSGGNLGGLALLDLMNSGINPGQALSGGVRMGDFMVASSGSVPLAGPDGRLQAFQTVFHPGAASPAHASVVTLKSGEERTDVNFQLRLIPTARVSGTAIGPDGPVANLGIRLVVPGDGGASPPEFDVATAITKPDGTFSFYGVPPGPFALRALRQPRPAIPAELMSDPAMQMAFGSGGTPGPTETLFAFANVTVAGDDIDGVMVQLAKGLRASGRMEFGSQTGRAPPTAAQFQTFTVRLIAADGSNQNALFSDQDRANAQGEFRTKGYPPGKYFLSMSAAGGWQVTSATVGGRDVLDAPLEIRDADVAGIVVTFTDRLAQVSGTVRAAGETDLSDTSVLLFPANYRAWAESGMNPRRAKTARASRSGAFTIANVPAGEYLAAAIDRASEGDMQDPAFIAALARIATRVTVGADAQTLELTKAKVTR